MDTKSNAPKLKLTSENVSKAYEMLGIEVPRSLTKSFGKEDEKKDESEEDKSKKKVDGKAEEKPDEKKVEKSKTEDSDEETSDDKKAKEAPEEKKLDAKAEEKEDDSKIEKSKKEELIESYEQGLSKKLENLGLINLDLSQKLEKSMAMFSKFEAFEKSVEATNIKLEKSISEMNRKISESDGAIEKSFNSAKVKDDSLLKSLQAVEERIQKIESTPNTRKSIDNLGYIQKSIDPRENPGQTENDQSGVKQLSLSRDRKEISEILFSKSMIGTGLSVNELYSNEVVSYENTGRLTKSIMNDLSKSEGVRFTS